MDRDMALEQLATAHAVALRLRDRGEPDEVIAHALAMPSEAVPHLLTIADAKLAAVLAARPREPDPDADPTGDPRPPVAS